VSGENLEREEAVMKNCRSRRGFTLIELLAVVVILGIIAVVLVPRISVSSTQAKKNACYQNKAEINSVAEKYFFDNGSAPADMAALNTAGYFPDGIPACPVDASAYTLDANGHVTGHAH
jgi:general secretion pathway protein G